MKNTEYKQMAEALLDSGKTEQYTIAELAQVIFKDSHGDINDNWETMGSNSKTMSLVDNALEEAQDIVQLIALSN